MVDKIVWPVFREEELEESRLARVNEYGGAGSTWQPPKPEMPPPRTFRPPPKEQRKCYRAASLTAMSDGCTILPALAGCPNRLLHESWSRNQPKGSKASGEPSSSVKLPQIPGNPFGPWGNFGNTGGFMEAFRSKRQVVDQEVYSRKAAEEVDDTMPAEGSNAMASESFDSVAFGKEAARTRRAQISSHDSRESPDEPVKRHEGYRVFDKARETDRNFQKRKRKQVDSLKRRYEEPERYEDAVSIVAMIIRDNGSQLLVEDALQNAGCRGSRFGSILKPVSAGQKLSRVRSDAAKSFQALLLVRIPIEERSRVAVSIQEPRGNKAFVICLKLLWNEMTPNCEEEVSMVYLIEHLSKMKRSTAKSVMRALIDNGRPRSVQVEDLMRICWPYATEEDVQAMNEMMEEYMAENNKPKEIPLMTEEMQEGLISVFHYTDIERRGGLTRDQLIDAELLYPDSEVHEDIFGEDGTKLCNLRQFLQLMCPQGYALRGGWEGAAFSESQTVSPKALQSTVDTTITLDHGSDILE